MRTKRATEIAMPRITTLWMIAAVALALPTASFAQSQPKDAKEPPLTGNVAFGKILYDKACMSCHGMTGTGTDKGPPFLHRVYHPGHHGDASFFHAVQQGVKAHHWRFGDMKAVPGLGQREIELIVGYVRALQKMNGLF